MTELSSSTLDDLLNEVRTAKSITGQTVLQGIHELNHRDRIVYASQLYSEIAKGLLEKGFDSEDNRDDAIDTLQVIQLCASSELHDMAYRDSLTNLPNRRKWDEEEISDNVAYGVLMFDIDKFKSWNDTYGHGVGDMALKVVGYILETSIREGIAGRYGGEEFYGILKDVDSSDQVRAAGERVRATLEKEGMVHLYQLMDREIQCMQMKRETNEAYKLAQGLQKLRDDGASLTISAGFAMGIGNGLDATKNKADIALYNAKNGGRNQVVEYKEGMTMPED